MRYLFSRGDHFRFGSVFIKKNIQTEFFFKKKTETCLNQPVLVRFGFLEQKPVQTGLARFFSGLAWFFSVWVRFGFFSFRLIKLKPNRTSRVFQNSNRFNRIFFMVRFFRLFFF
jgi:hypothetical protein